MPITEDGRCIYNIPPEIKEKIPPMFYQALFGEIISVFGFSRLIPCKEYYTEFKDTPDSGYTAMVSDIITGSSETSGWQAAFIQTCMKLSMGWLVDYDKSLEYYDRDCFYYELSQEMIKSFCVTDHKSANEYYGYLLEIQKPIRQASSHNV